MLVHGARVVRVLREGERLCIVAQMPTSNTVLKCTVDLERSQRNIRAQHLEENRVVTLEVLSCDPPGVVVGVSAALSKHEEGAVGLENFQRFQRAYAERACAQPAERAGALPAERAGAQPAERAARKRPCFFPDHDEGGCQN